MHFKNTGKVSSQAITTMQFTGRIQARADVKGRLFFPADFRRQLDSADQRLVLRRDAWEPCLTIYPYAAWEAEVGELRARLNLWDPTERAVYRQFLSDVTVAELDAAGRFLVPRHLIALLGDDRRVTFIGLDDRIELWSAAQTERPFMPAEDFAAKLSALMSGMNA